MTDLIYKASYAFVINIPNCKVGKEGVHRSLMEIVTRQGSDYLAQRWSSWQHDDSSLLCSYVGEPFSNLCFEEIVKITDESIIYKYTEHTDQRIMLPNISCFIYMLLFAIKTVEQLGEGFEVRPVVCEINIENNADTYFYEKYNPLAVEYSPMLKYAVGQNMGYEIKMECHADIYVLMNRFYNQYKSEGSLAKPYITLIKDDFERIYDAI